MTTRTPTLRAQLSPRARHIVVAVAAMALVMMLHWAYSTRYSALDLGWMWTAARLWLDGVDPYSAQATFVLRPNVTSETASGFPYPFPVILFVLPLALLPLSWASTVWGSVSLVTIIALPWELHRRPAPAVALLPFLYFPFWAGMEQAQWGPMFLAFALLSVHWQRTGQQRLAGAVLPLFLLKPQLGIAIVLALAAYQLMCGIDRRWLEGLLIGGALIWGGSLLIWPVWPLGWLQQLRFYSDEGHNVVQLLAPLGLATGGLSGAVVAAGWRKRDPELVLTGLLVLGMLVLPMRGFYNQTILLLPLIALGGRLPWAALVTSVGSWGVFALVLAGLDAEAATVLALYAPPLALGLAALLRPAEGRAAPAPVSLSAPTPSPPADRVQ